jgi:hypothetical protein
MNYKSNDREIAEHQANIAVSNAVVGCTPHLCPTFHVYGGDCAHMAHAEAILEGFEYQWNDASAHVEALGKALNPGHRDAHVRAWEKENGEIPF